MTQASVAKRDPILVTGGTGHTGRRLVSALADRGENVRVLTREPTRIPVELRRRVEIVRADLTDRDAARDVMAGCGAVIAMTHIKFAPLVIEAMKSGGVKRGIFTSSTRRFTKFPETTARQVIEGETAVESSGLDFTIIRPSMIYGGKQDNNLENLLAALRKYPVFPLPGGGTMKWQPVFTWDVVEALLAALEKPDIAIGKSYTIAGPDELTYREMLETMKGEAGLRTLLLPLPLGVIRAVVRCYEKVSNHPRVRMDQIQRMEEDKVFDISRARQELGFHPITFREGIKRKIKETA